MLQGKVAIVTGSGRGVGREIAMLMAKYGARVVINDPGVAGDGTGKDQGPAAQTANDIKAAGGMAVPNFDSVTSFEGATNMVKQALQELGGLHIVVNNAGILRDRMLHKMSPEDWQAVIDTHLTGHFNVCRAAINHFREQNYGRIINVTSTSGTIGNYGQANYGAAKLGIVGFTRTLAMENGQKGITVNAISPSAWTRMTQSIPPKDEAGKARVEKLKRMKAEDIAPLAVFLASEQAGYVNGQVFGQRAGEVAVYDFNRPVMMIHDHAWTPELVGEKAMHAFRSRMTPLQVTTDVFPYDPMD